MGLFDSIAKMPGASWLNNTLNPEGGYQNAQNASNQYYNQSNQMLAPYAQAGMQGNDRLNQGYNALSDPAALQAQWAQGYKQSPYAQQLQQGAMDTGLNAAGSMGLMGSSAALNNIQNESSNIANADFQQYMNDLMQKYMSAMGIAGNQFSTGASAAGMQSGNAMRQGENQAGLEFGKYNAGPNMLMNLLRMGGSGAMGGMGGGM